MSYTFAICNATLPRGFAAAEEEAARLQEVTEPAPAVFNDLVDRLTARYPCICDLPDDDDSGPWCSGPLRQESYTRATVFGLVFSRVDEVLPFVIKTATALGLSVVDWQTGKVHRPKAAEPLRRIRGVSDDTRPGIAETSMTTEDGFQAALDADPADWQTRLAFADWLQERGDERADGYRALGRLERTAAEYYGPNRRPRKWEPQKRTHWATTTEFPESWRSLPEDWLAAVGTGPSGRFSKKFSNRREAEDAAALAFAKLPAGRRTELLAAGPE